MSTEKHNSDENQKLIRKLKAQIRREKNLRFFHSGDARDEARQSREWFQAHYGVARDRMIEINKILLASGKAICRNVDNPIAYVADWLEAMKKYEQGELA